MSDSARACLRRSLLAELSSLSAGAIYERFAQGPSGHWPAGPRGPSNAQYHRFVADMKANGWRQLFEDKPVLLRLMASLTRQWIDASPELITRLDADLPAIRRDLLDDRHPVEVTSIDSDLSDRHNFGRTVAIIGFQDGSRVVYKPKDLRVDAAWHALIDTLNRRAPVELRAVRVLARQVTAGRSSSITRVVLIGRAFSDTSVERAHGWRSSTASSASTCIKRTSSRAESIRYRSTWR